MGALDKEDAKDDSVNMGDGISYSGHNHVILRIEGDAEDGYGRYGGEGDNTNSGEMYSRHNYGTRPNISNR